MQTLLDKSDQAAFHEIAKERGKSLSEIVRELVRRYLEEQRQVESEKFRALLKPALRWAERLGESKAYNAQYVALAKQFEAELWGTDERW